MRNSSKCRQETADKNGAHSASAPHVRPNFIHANYRIELCQPDDADQRNLPVLLLLTQNIQLNPRNKIFLDSIGRPTLILAGVRLINRRELKLWTEQLARVIHLFPLYFGLWLSTCQTRNVGRPPGMIFDISWLLNPLQLDCSSIILVAIGKF